MTGAHIVTKFAQAATVVAIAAGLAACGGGGGGSSPTPVTSSPGTTGSSQASTTPGASASPSHSPSPAANAAVVTGKAVDIISGAPLVGFTVTYGPQANTATNAGGTTAADGSFQFSASPTNAASMVQISPPSGSAYTTYHGAVVLATGLQLVGTIKMTALTAEQQSEITLINHDRATISSLPALIPDEISVEVAEYHAMDMAGLTGLGPPYYGHDDRNGLTPAQRYVAAGGLGGNAENLCTGVSVSYATCESEYIAEGPGGGHYSNIMTNVEGWIGVGSATATPVSGQTQSTYYDEEYTGF